MPEFSRRQLFKLRFDDLTREIGDAVGPKKDSGESTTPEAQKFFRPPGASAIEEDFLSACERCHACADACPYECIDDFGPAAGRLEGTPFIDPRTVPCRWCEDMPCIKACPGDALQERPDQTVQPIGKVALDLKKCLNSEGILCDTCAYRCPTHIKAIRIVNRMPVLDLERCTGCGMCVYFCEAEPSAFEPQFFDPATP